MKRKLTRHSSQVMHYKQRVQQEQRGAIQVHGLAKPRGVSGLAGEGKGRKHLMV